MFPFSEQCPCNSLNCLGHFKKFDDDDDYIYINYLSFLQLNLVLVNCILLLIKFC